MKLLTICLAISLSFCVLAEDKKCKDSNFDELGEYSTYGDIEASEAFDVLFKSDSPAPMGYPEMFAFGDICRDVTATYLKHIETGTKYVMYTTHDDYCDGGNTIGYVIDLKKYSDEDSKFENAIVGEIGDSDFYCRK